MGVLSLPLVVGFAVFFALASLLLRLLQVSSGPMRLLPGPRWAWIFQLNPKLMANGFRRYRTPQDIHAYVEQYNYPRFLRLSDVHIIVSDTEVIQSLTKSFDRDPRKHDYYLGMQRWIGKNVFSIIDKFEHKSHRRILASSFSMQCIRGMMSSILSSGIIPVKEKLRKVASAETADGRIIDLSEEFHGVFLDIIGEIALGGSFQMLENNHHPLPKKIRCIFQGLSRASLFSWAYERFDFIPGIARFKQSLGYLQYFAKNVIETRRQSNHAHPDKKYADLLQSLIDCTDPDSGARLTDDEIVSDIIAFIMAGSDTNSNTCSWFIYMMTQHPDVLAKLRAEIDSVSSDPSEVPSCDQVKDLPYFNAVLNETMRLHPVGANASTRILDRDEYIADQFFPRGTAICWNVYSMHRSKLYWSRPDDFYPERFLGDNPEPSHPVAFMPFSLGSRNCIGRNLAMVELRMILPMLVKLFDFEYVGPPMEAINRFVYSPKHGLPVQVRLRQF